MKKIAFLLCMMVGSVYADTTGPLTSSWGGVVTGTHPNNCCSGGPQPLYDPNTGIVHFSYGQYTVSQTIAINNALSGSGVQIGGYNYQYDLRNLNGVMGGQGGTDTITVYTYMKDNQGITVGDSSVIHNTPFDWQTFRGTVNLLNEMPLTNAGHMGIQFTSRDAGFWAGYYGPQVRNVSMSINYTATPIDPCTSDPLSSPSCPGYQQAYHDQQCSANPLYATSCPGYQNAYYAQQCSISPLYDSSCPGYQQAYFNQQCSINPLYNNQCNGYQQAYFNQQCSLNPLYNSSCNGYEQAYFNQQCSNNPLYDRGCPGYAQEYAKQQLLNQQNNQASTETTQTITLPTVTEPTVQVSSKGQVSTEVQLVADPVVNEVLKESAKVEAKSSVSEPAPVATTTTTTTSVQTTQNTEQKQEQKKTDNEIAKIESKSDSKDNKSNREKVKEALTEKAKELANEMSNAATLEAQAANQGLVLGLMNYNPAFSAYANSIIPDTGGVEMARQYNKPVVDNRRALRIMSGASDSLHQQMVDEQYR